MDSAGYHVEVHFSKASKQSVEDKLKGAILHGAGKNTRKWKMF